MAGQVLVLPLGGTIDAQAYPDPAHPPEHATMLKKSIIPETIEKLGFADCCDIDASLPRRDSKSFSKKDIEALAEKIRCAPHRHILITHGTDWMPRNARALKRALGATDKTIVFTGAMIPIANGAVSDGPENICFALQHRTMFAPGVHVVMHGRLFEIKGLRKDRQRMQFCTAASISDEDDEKYDTMNL